MATVIEDLIVQLKAHDDNIIPQVRGLDDLSKVTLSEGLKDILRQELEDRNRRRDRVATVFARIGDFNVALQSLIDDGYPNMEKRALTPEQEFELTEQFADFAAAREELISEVAKPKFEFGTGVAEDKPK